MGTATPTTSERGRDIGILEEFDRDRGCWLVLPSSAFSYNRGVPLDIVPRGGQNG